MGGIDYRNAVIRSLQVTIQNLQDLAQVHLRDSNKGSLRKTLKQLQDLRLKIDKLLCQYWSHGIAHEETLQEMCLTKLAALCQQEYKVVDESEGEEKSLCDDSLKDNIIKDLKYLESSFDFHAKFTYEVRQLCSDRLGRGNFAYGSTPYDSWVAVLNIAEISGQIEDMQRNEQKIYMVWGSSIGWLIFYLRLNYNIQCVGYEILQCHVQEAEYIKQKYNMTKIQFFCEDLLNSDLSNVAILVLTSFCWDQDIKNKAYTKICRELCDDALVIDYSDELVLLYGNYVVVSDICVPVSWNDQQKIFIMTKQQSY